jgi:hypothetical protein
MAEEAWGEGGEGTLGTGGTHSRESPGLIGLMSDGEGEGEAMETAEQGH